MKIGIDEKMGAGAVEVLRGLVCAHGQKTGLTAKKHERQKNGEAWLKHTDGMTGFARIFEMSLDGKKAWVGKNRWALARWLDEVQFS